MAYNRSLYGIAVALLTLGACHPVPKHARLIPKDATAVIGVNMSNISKEVAWGRITGSHILDELSKSSDDPKAKEAIKDIEHMGIDWMSTLYFYTRTDTRFQGGQKGAALAPLKDEAEWEGWVKKVFPAAVVRTAGNLKEVMLNKVLAAWDGSVLMVTNSIVNKVPRKVRINVDSLLGGPPLYQEFTVNDEVPDETATVAEMEEAFKLPAEASITANKRFNDLMHEGHDLSFFINYDDIMNSAAAMSGGLISASLGNTLWKDAAMAGGIDFEKGQVSGRFHYYWSDSLQAIAKEFGKKNVDAGMIARIPPDHLNVAGGCHLSMSAVKMLLDKLGYTGIANMQLTLADLTVDDVLGAFTGDIAFAMNNFSIETKMMGNDTISASLGMKPYPTTIPKMDYIIAMKINNRAAFDKLLSFATHEGILVGMSPNIYSAGAAGILVTSDNYIVLSNNMGNGQAYIDRSGSIPPALRAVTGHPFGFYADIQNTLVPSRAAIFGGPPDSLSFEASRILDNISAHGGEYRNGGNEWSFKLRMMDKDENSLLQLIQMGQRASTQH